ncbi:hypothetical protein QR680_004348 [Steinernema hermaphroditum]|nr:hypothetical protein QR680_004348 [Steinernema hermaphroditum]
MYLDPFRSVSSAISSFVPREVVHVVQVKLHASREKSTVHKYNNAVKKFQAWRSERAHIEASESELLAFLAQLFVESNSVATVQQTSSALKWYYRFFPGPNPAESIWIQAMLEGIRREGKLPEPSEGTSLRHCNVDLSIDKMVLSIVKDKTNKEGSARKVIVQAAPNRFCAVNLMSIWLQRAPNSPYVFPNLNESSRPMSYAVARQEWIRIASKLGIPSNITPHGFRGGAATQAIADGAPVDEVMRHGRWKRVETLKAYVEASEKTTPVASTLLKRMRLGPDVSSHDETGKAKDSV